jgi:hypothetical protein
MPPKDIWEMDRIQREVVLQKRSDAVAQDRTPTIHAMAPMEPDPKPEGVLVRRVSDGWVTLADDGDAADLIASGEYRPLVADGRWNENGTLTSGADPEEIEFARKEHTAALARLLSTEEMERSVQDDFAAVESRIRSMNDEEREALEKTLVRVVAGAASGLVRGPVERS